MTESSSINPGEDFKPQVLVIDDSMDVHRLLRARLRTEELEFREATDGQAGLAIAEEHSPTVILLDLDMPGMDGFEVLRILKENPRTLQIPVIVLSGLQSSQDKVTAFDLGAVDYVTKPFDLTELRVRVRAAIKMQRLIRMLAQKAQIDGLTGLWNRVFFNSRLAEEMGRLSRREGNLALAVVDIDHFKSINDTYGHPAGDAVIQGLAKLLVKECRHTDSVCRYGGEEFGVIMPDTGATDARNVAERIRAAFEQLSWPRHPERKATVSIGVAAVAGTGALTPEALLEIADKNLYTAKNSGRNRVVSSVAELVKVPAHAA
ncbi:MAG: Response regulator PleD [Phycisphaerales bacterium]|nr:Response regulator PleD [Phycisphaerales bacterium]MCK6476490.1 diguanylate cyclase [Phycisphaerales bacterium]